MSTLFERWTGLTLLEPGLLWLALFLPIALLSGLRGKAPAIRCAPASIFEVPHSWRVRLLPLPFALQVLGLLCVVLALARPAVREPLPIESEGIDIVLCLDVSSSMDETDMEDKKTRLSVARDAAVAFIRARPDDRIGLLTFARYPDLRCPPTTDHEALERILAEAETVASDSPEDATGIGGAVARAAAVLGDSASPSRVVILLTDGEENVAMRGRREEIPPAHAAQLCERFGVRVYAITAGVGRRDSEGTYVPIDSTPVQRLAQRTGGSFHKARNAGDVVAVYERIDRLETAPIEEPRYVFADRHLLFLQLGIVLLALGFVLASLGLAVLP